MKNLVKLNVKVLVNIELPGWVYEMLSVGPNHPIRDKINETHFLADVDIFLSQLKSQKNLVKGYVKQKPGKGRFKKRKANPKRQSR